VADQRPDELIADIDGVEVFIEGERPGRFQAVVVSADARVVMLSVVEPAPPPVKVKYKGANDEFVTRPSGSHGPWPAVALGVTDPHFAPRLNERLFQALDSGPGAPGHWLLDEGSLDDFIAAVAARRQAEAVEAERRRQQRQGQLRRDERANKQDSHFVNPYTFVPLPETPPARSMPPGHARSDDTHPLVQINVTWIAETPLATGSSYDAGDGRSGLAGSAVKGALRTLHESLTGSCLRVVDMEGAPSHREPMSAGQGRRLSRVHDISEPSGSGDRVVTLELADRTVWVSSDLLPTSLTSGKPCDVSRVNGTVEHIRAFGREQVRPGADAGPALTHPDMEWVPLLSKPGARQGHGYYVALGAFPRSPADRELVRVSEFDLAWKQYARAAGGSEDERARRRTGDLDLTVTWKGRTVGSRQPVLYALDGPDRIAPGHMLWVTLAAGTVSHLAAAYVWRRLAGVSSLGDRDAL
jgi:hypothetical protein